MKMRIVALVALVALCLLSPSPSLSQTQATQVPVTFAFPLVCTLNSDCYAANYIDHDPSPGLRDYQCGSSTYDGHEGFDVLLLNFRIMDRGVPVLAAADGVVREIRDGLFDRRKRRGAGGLGNYVMIEHSGGIRTYYGHLKKNSIKVRIGERVTKGQEIGQVGSSGDSAEAHLHFEVRDPHGAVIEPFMGPCGNSISWWDEQPPYDDSFQLLDFGLINFEPTIDRLKDRPATQTNFVVGRDPRAVFWVQVRNVKRGDRGRIAFYQPDGVLAWEYSWVHDRFYTHGWWWAWKNIYPQTARGRWSVKYYMNGRLVVNASFQVLSHTPQAPQIWIPETRFNFGQVEVGRSRTYRLIIENIGAKDLNASISSSNPAFKVDPTKVTVPPNRTELVDITFAPTEEGRLRGELTITSDDPANRTLKISLEGFGSAAR